MYISIEQDKAQLGQRSSVRAWYWMLEKTLQQSRGVKIGRCLGLTRQTRVKFRQAIANTQLTQYQGAIVEISYSTTMFTELYLLEININSACRHHARCVPSYFECTLSECTLSVQVRIRSELQLLLAIP